ncbi:MAG: SAM-dependent methyltransferase, partial [Clostridia bacterium]|nr:SAM-dependent methyltransferase [Clostridia bacterium]
MERARERFERIAEDESLILAVFSNPRKKSAAVRKVSLRPVLLKGELRYQAEYAYEKKVTHENLLPGEIADFAVRQIQASFKQADVYTKAADALVLANKPDHVRVTEKPPTKTMGALEHDRKKHYLIPEGEPADFLVRLGVQTRDGQVVAKHRG